MKDTTDHIVDPSYDYRQKPWFEHGDERPCNWSSNPTFYDVVEARLSRRTVMQGGLAAAVTSVYGLSFASAVRARELPADLIGFKPVMVSEDDTIVVPEGYRAHVICRAGDPISGDMPAYRRDNTGAEQEHQIGQHHDGMHFFPVDGSSEDGYLVINHEYIEPRYLHGAYEGKPLDAGAVVYLEGATAGGETAARDEEAGSPRRDADEVLKELHAHGVSIVRVRKGEDGNWKIVEDPLNRRIHGLTEMEIGGPVRGHDLVKTKYSPDGTRVRGTLNNCAHGVTPWNTYLAAEENWAGYFTNADTYDQKPDQPREHARYGVATDPLGRYGWAVAEGDDDRFLRFDARARGADATEDYRNEPNAFGWMVEIDPFDPEKKPVKRTHLGRFAHEGVIFAPARPGHPIVCYSGDDARFEYIYKFVSAANYDPETTDGSILDEGTLYVARFNDDGTGEWIALRPGENGITDFADMGELLVNTRAAADQAGATKMDRPEWGAVDPNTGEVYFTLTNNNRRIQAQVDMANPRAQNEFGHIIRWKERSEDHSGTEFDWDLFVIAGGPETSADLAGNPLDETNIFACPDGLWIDPDSRVWIQTDIGESSMNQGDFAQFGNNAMLCANPVTGEIRRFLTGPIGQEITGVITTPDQRTMFINVQHPGATTTAEDYAAGRHLSHWPDGGDAWPRSATVVITKEDGGIIGT
jgi:secreted PhoX family phosphatase